MYLHMTHGPLQGPVPLGINFGFMSVCTRICLRLVQRFCTRTKRRCRICCRSCESDRIFVLFCRILLTGGFPGLNVSMNGIILLERFGCEDLSCSSSCLLVLAAFCIACSIICVG